MSTTKLNHDDARAACKETGGDLASITNQAEMDFIASHS